MNATITEKQTKITVITPSLKLKGLRTMCDITGEKMAQFLNLSRNGYIKKETGKNTFKEHEKEKILKLLQSHGIVITYDELFL